MTDIINVKLDKGAYMPERAHEEDAGADIRTPRAFSIEPRGSATIHTGVHVELPYGTVGMIKTKSGLNHNHDIVTEGVIDRGYTGEIVVKMHNLGDQHKFFNRGDKITQLVVMPIVLTKFREVSMVFGGERGDNGFGSTDGQA